MSERIVKGVCFEDVQSGYVVWEKKGDPHTISSVSRIRCEGEVYVALYEKDEKGEERMALHGEPDQFIGLVHRPWPEGKTAEDMRDAIAGFSWEVMTDSDLHCANSGHGMENSIEALRGAIDDYLLGKPLNTACGERNQTALRAELTSEELQKLDD